MSLAELEEKHAELEKHVSRWDHWTAKGSGEVLSKLLDGLTVRMKNEWQPLKEDELRPYGTLVRPRSAWFGLATPLPDVGRVTLSLERRGESVLHGGRVLYNLPPGERGYPVSTPSIPAAWRQIMRFLDEGIIPAARAAGAVINAPTPEEVFIAELPGDTSEQLHEFSNGARKSLPLDTKTAELWRKFVIGAFRDKAIIYPNLFTDWLVKDGWDRDAAMELRLRFYDQCKLLSQYKDEVYAE